VTGVSIRSRAAAPPRGSDVVGDDDAIDRDLLRDRAVGDEQEAEAVEGVVGDADLLRTDVRHGRVASTWPVTIGKVVSKSALKTVWAVGIASRLLAAIPREIGSIGFLSRREGEGTWSLVNQSPAVTSAR